MASKLKRVNTYMVWFRVDQSTCEFYKSINNSISLVHSVPITVQSNQWYDYKVLYNSVSGEIRVYQNNNYIGNWIDTIPLTNGNAISFRSGNSDYMINDLKVYKLRAASEVLSVGPAAANDVQYQNINPITSSCKINSIVKDYSGNLSNISSQSFNIDWTPPSIINTLNDSLGMDVSITTSPNTLAANWSSSADTNSAIARYWYAIGTTSGATDMLNWTDNLLNIQAIDLLSNLINGQTYYYSVKAENGAGLQSAIVSSNGQTLQLPNNIYETDNVNYAIVYPNPFSYQTTLNYFLEENDFIKITLHDILGNEFLLLNEKQNKGVNKLVIDTNSLHLSSGIYLLSIKNSYRSNAITLLIK